MNTWPPGGAGHVKESPWRSVHARGRNRRLPTTKRRGKAESQTPATEAALRTALDELNELYEHAPCAYHSLDADGLYLRVNQTELDWLGYTREEVVGKMHVADILTPESLSTFASAFPVLMERGFIQDVAVTMIRRDGALLPVLASARAARDSDGTFLRSMSTMVDLTECKQVEKSLLESRALLQSIMDGTTDAVYVKDTEGRYLFFNAAAERITGQSAADVLGRDDTALVRPDEAAEVMRGDHKVMDSGAVATYEEYVTDAAGKVSTLLSTKGPIRDAAGRTRGLFGIARDISERRVAEDEIRRLNDELEELLSARTSQLGAVSSELEAFAYATRHDVRAPLRAIDGFTQIIADEAGERLSPEHLAHLGRVRAAAQRMGELLDDLLGLSRVSGRDLQRETVDVSAMARAVGDEQCSSHPKRHVKLTVQSGLTALADPALLRVVLANLLGNAWKFTAPRAKAHVEIGVADSAYGSAFFVRDDGVGFDMTYATHLFGVFQRLHPVGQFAGTGVGLATVKRIVHRHGGCVWAESEVDKGACFHFMLPPTLPPEGVAK
jgi:PAS domain S-box-containing protein